MYSHRYNFDNLVYYFVLENAFSLLFHFINNIVRYMYTTRIYRKYDIYSPTAFSYLSVRRYGIKLHASYTVKAEKQNRKARLLKISWYITSGRLVTTLLIESPTIYKRMLLLAEISSIWNRANHFYCHETFYLTFFSK